MHVVRMRNKDKGFTKKNFVEESLYIYVSPKVRPLATTYKDSNFVRNYEHAYL